MSSSPRRLLAPVALGLAVALLAVALPTLSPGLLGSAGIAAAQDARAQAKQRYASGKAHYEARRYQEAIAEFRAADQLAPSGVNDFNIALAYEGLGDGAAAVAHYRAYLERVPEAPNRAEVEAAIARLGAGTSAPPPDVSVGTVSERAPEPPPVTTTAPARTGDPELDRVAAIDVGAVRDQRGALPTGARGGEAPSPEQAGQPPSPNQPAPAQPAKAKPLYKQWWFWVVAGIGAYVLVSMATNSSSDVQPGTETPARLPMPEVGGGGGAPAGVAVWRF